MLKTRGQDTALLLGRLAALGTRALTRPSLAPKQVCSFLAISRHQWALLFNSCIYLEDEGGCGSSSTTSQRHHQSTQTGQPEASN